MFRLLRLFHTSIGRKLVMALSGIILILFMIAHMLGNLAVYQGQGAANAYAAWLQGHPLLWAVRLVLLGIFLFHIAIGLQLAIENRRARDKPYRMQTPQRSRFAERHMVLSGMIVLVFFVYHLMHLTLGWIDPAQAATLIDTQGRPDVYSKVVLGFQNIWVAAVYLLGMGLLALHLHHATQSIFQTLGFNHETYQTLVIYGSVLLTSIIIIGLASIPIAVQLGFLTLPAGVPAS